MSSINDPNLSVLDTFKVKSRGIFLKDLHIERTINSFSALKLDVPTEKIIELYDKIEKETISNEDKIARLVISCDDFLFHYEFSKITAPLEKVNLAIVTTAKQVSGKGLHNYKWSDRTYWEKVLALKPSQADDVLSINNLNQVTETSRFNLFFYDKHSDLVYTPFLESGCLQGTYREWVLKNKFIQLPKFGAKTIIEKVINLDDLNLYQVFVANSVREVLLAEVIN